MSEMPARPPCILWVDLRARQADESIPEELRDRVEVHRVASATELADAIRAHAPRLLCFDYDYPDLPALRLLQQISAKHRALPILMLTEYHSEALAVWALRTRVWDYFVKPVSSRDLADRVARILSLSTGCLEAAARVNAMPAPPVPAELRFRGPAARRSVQAAISYIEANYAERIPLETVARLCGLGPFQFCRAFKREQGSTFQGFLARQRIRQAEKLLGHPRATVTEVALAVGFNDVSHFARVFRRHVGLPPSVFRSRIDPQAGARARRTPPPASPAGE